MTFDHDPNKVIPDTIDGALNALKAAYSEASVKRFVLTSSSDATVSVIVGKPGIMVNEKTWNEDAVEAAWAPPPYTPERAWAVYGASKTQAEQDVWKYHREHKSERPDLVVNTGKPHLGLLLRDADNGIVLPSTNFGKSVDPVHQGYPSSSGLPALLWKGEVTDLHQATPRRMFTYLDTSMITGSHFGRVLRRQRRQWQAARRGGYPGARQRSAHHGLC